LIISTLTLMTTSKMSEGYARLKLTKGNKMTPIQTLDHALELLKQKEGDSLKGHAIAYASLVGYLMATATPAQADKVLGYVKEGLAK
jgi:hypothetical protein